MLCLPLVVVVDQVVRLALVVDRFVVDSIDFDSENVAFLVVRLVDLAVPSVGRASSVAEKTLTKAYFLCTFGEKAIKLYSIHYSSFQFPNL